MSVGADQDTDQARLAAIEDKLDGLIDLVGVLVDMFGSKLPMRHRLVVAAALKKMGRDDT